MAGHHQPASEMQLNGLSLADQCWPALFVKSTTKIKKRTNFGPGPPTPNNDKTFWIRAWREREREREYVRLAELPDIVHARLLLFLFSKTRNSQSKLLLDVLIRVCFKCRTERSRQSHVSP